MANVPDTNTFSLQDVVNVVNPSMGSEIPTDKYDLKDCFTDAIPQYFVHKYEGSKDRLSNFRGYGGKAWFIFKPHRTIGIDDAPLLLDTAFSSVYGDAIPDSFEFSYDRNICNDNLDVVLIGGTGANIYLDNTQNIIIHPYEYTYSMRDSLNNVGYTGSKVGTWYWGFSVGLENLLPWLKIRDVDTDFWDNYTIYMAFEVVESITPTSFDLSGVYHTCAIDTHVDGNFTLSKVGTIDWITITNGTGSDQDGATFTVDTNSSSTDRTAQLKLSTDANDFYIDITQSSENISASPNLFSVTYRKTTKSSTVTTLPTAGKWSVQSSPSWINAYKSNYNTVVMQIEANTHQFGRIGFVVLVHDDDSNVTEAINIGQEGGV